MKTVRKTAIATNIVILVVVALTIWAELSKPLKDFLTKLTTHHWVTKGAFALVLFIFLNLIMSKTIKKEKDIWNQTKLVLLITAIGTIAITGFFIWHYFSA